jgi:membrane associated rhomboid family serine protease
MMVNWFAVPGKNTFDAGNMRHWITIFTHIMGHANWTHFIGNFTLILLIGPMLEESYGSLNLLIMILITALVTGVLNILFFNSMLMGASGVVFMMILLSSFTNFSHGEIPLTFILVLVLYMGVQFYNSLTQDNISQFAHIIGGLCGSFFGFLHSPKRGRV